MSWKPARLARFANRRRVDRRFSPEGISGLRSQLEDRASTSTLFFLNPGTTGLGTPLQAGATAWIEALADLNQNFVDGTTSTGTSALETLDSASLPNLIRRLTVGFHYVDGGSVHANVQAPAQYAPAPGENATGTTSFEIDVTHSHSDLATNDNGVQAVNNQGAGTITNTFSGVNTADGPVVLPMWIAVESTDPNSTITAHFNASILGSFDPRYNVISNLVITSPYMVVVDNADDPTTGNYDNGLVVENATGTVIYYQDSGFGNDQARHDTPNISSAPTPVGVTSYPPPAIPVTYDSNLATTLLGTRTYAAGESVGGAVAFSWSFKLTTS